MTSTPYPNRHSVKQMLDAMQSRLDRLESEFRDRGAFLLDGLRAHTYSVSLATVSKN